MNMDLGLGNTLLAGDPRLVDHIVGEVKSQGIFDQFRKECIADVDTKPAYQNLRTRVESSVNSFLGKQTWRADLNKNQLRETLRKHIVEAPYLDAGVERIVDQVVNPKVYSVFMPQIEDVVYKFMGLERPKNRQRNGPCGFKDLLPKDLDPVSPESDKNSLKDVSLDSVDAHVENPDSRDKETPMSGVELSRKDDTDHNSNDKVIGRNGDAEIEENSIDVSAKASTAVNLINLNSSGKSDDKTEEEEEDSPSFEPIDIMNLNESNISNDSHLSGISELTSHRSRSPDYSNDGSRDNMDFSNQDSQFSKVSSDSRLSIVTDFGSSNHASTPLSDALKDDKTDSRYSKDNFKAVREFESGKGNKDGKSGFESDRSKENTPSDFKPNRPSCFSSKETSRDGMESGTKDCQRNDSKSRRSDPKDFKREREKDNRKKSNNHDAKGSEKSSKKSVKDKPEEKSREKDKEKEKKEPEKKDKVEAKETKDLKDIYKEKIRELREKKELTEKEKLSKDKDLKAPKDMKEKRDSSRDKRESKDHKSSSSKNSSRSENKNAKSSSANETKGARSESRDKGKRDDRRYAKDNKSRSTNAPSDEKGEGKRLSRSDDKTEKSEVKDSKLKTAAVKKDGKNGEKRESKSEADKEKKRREEKKTKAKDDHSSLRKNSEDRRSTDRDGSNGSNGKSSQKSGSNSGTSSTKPPASNLPKESTNTNNSSSETSDTIEESQNEQLRLSFETKNVGNSKTTREYESQAKKLDLGQNEVTLPIKRRLVGDGSVVAGGGEVIMKKKPKFAKNIHEAKRFDKIRKQIDEETIKWQQEIEKNDLELVPDDERVQIIEVCDEEYDEPYPEVRTTFTLEERSQIILGGESIFMGDLPITEFRAKTTLSEMELAIRQSLNEMISDNKINETHHTLKNDKSTTEESEFSKGNESVKCPEETWCQEIESSSNTEENLTTICTVLEAGKPKVAETTVQPTKKSENEEKISDTKNEKNEEKLARLKNEENLETVTVTEKKEHKENVAEIEAGENKGNVSKIESEGNKMMTETGDEKNNEAVAETENEENKETVAGTKNEDNKEKITDTEPEVNEKVADIERENMAETESEEKMAETEENENEENKKNVFNTGNYESEQTMVDAENLINKENVTDMKNEENMEKVAGIKTEENEEKVAGIKTEENEGMVVGIKKGENEEKVFDTKNEENEEKVVVIETCTKEDEIVREAKNAQTLESPDNVEAVKSPVNDKGKEVVSIVSDKKAETLEAPVNEIEPAIEAGASEVPVKMEVEANPCELIAVKTTETCSKTGITCQEVPAYVEEDSAYLSDEVPCLYFEEDNERLIKFAKFMKVLEHEDEPTCSSAEPAADTVDSLCIDEAVSSLSKPMAPPKPKRKYSTSPLTDILLNNANNNNDAHKLTRAIADDEVEPDSLKKRKIGRPKKQSSSASLCGQQNLLNGENFVMPLSPESDVSATSEKTPSNPPKDEKSRLRGSNQRYTSDDLYKPRPLFASSSRRSRRSNPA